jgi:hypothetical protein
MVLRWAGDRSLSVGRLGGMVGDPAELHRLAHRMRAEAEEVRHVAAWAGATAGVPWRSPAAELFRERVHERVGALRRVARQLEEAADLLGAHARAVATVFARGEEVAREVTERAREAWRD